jgi:hypothetical protein
VKNPQTAHPGATESDDHEPGRPTAPPKAGLITPRGMRRHDFPNFATEADTAQEPTPIPDEGEPQ